MSIPLKSALQLVFEKHRAGIPCTVTNLLLGNAQKIYDRPSQTTFNGDAGVMDKSALHSVFSVAYPHHHSA